VAKRVPGAAQARRLPAFDMADPDDLETRIQRAERAVGERDQRVLQRSRELLSRVEHGARRGVGGGLLAGLTALGVAWWMPSRRRAALPAAQPAAASVPWAALVPLLWPLLPPTVRRRLSPATAAMLAGVGVPLLRSMLPQRAPVHTVAEVDLARYAGRWYEMARLPAPRDGGCASAATATYTLRGDQLEIDQRCRSTDGSERRAQGVAYAVEGSRGAKLEVSLWSAWLRWLPWAWAGHWIVDVDAAYQHAVVGTPGRQGLWLLARQPHIDEATYARMVGIAAAQGFRVDRLQRIQHG
jgi:apolipoprotein D and lipocalin family protein